MSRMTEQKEQQIRVWAESCLFKHDKAKIKELLAEIEALRSELETKNKLFKEVSHSELRHDIVKDEAVLERNQLREQLAATKLVCSEEYGRGHRTASADADAEIEALREQLAVAEREIQRLKKCLK